MPEQTSRVYLHAELSRADWAKVLAWACSMDHVLRTKGVKVHFHIMTSKSSLACCTPRLLITQLLFPMAAYAQEISPVHPMLSVHS